MHEWGTKVKCTHQLDGDMFVVVQVLPCSAEGEGEEKEREREGGREGERERERSNKDSLLIHILAVIIAPEMRVTPLIRRLMISA